MSVKNVTKSGQSGFTLVELAISMAVIGLLIGGILKGMELAENAKTTSMIKQVSGYNSSAATFMGMYNALPGDLKNPAHHLPNCDSTPCSISGNEDGVVISETSCGYGGLNCEGRMEQVNFFIHMNASGVMKGSLRLYGTHSAGGETVEQYVPDGFPYNSVNTIVLYHTRKPNTTDPFDFTQEPAPRAGHFYAIWNLSTKVTEKIDIKIDDGFPFTGSIRIHKTASENVGTVKRYVDMTRWNQNLDSQVFWMTDF